MGGNWSGDRGGVKTVTLGAQELMEGIVDPILHIKDLRCFVSVYEQRSFSRAADELDTVQSLVSTRVQRLERFVGARLFTRLPHGIEPNKHGEMVYRHAKNMLRNLAELEAELGRGAN